MNQPLYFYYLCFLPLPVCLCLLPELTKHCCACAVFHQLKNVLSGNWTTSICIHVTADLITQLSNKYSTHRIYSISLKHTEVKLKLSSFIQIFSFYKINSSNCKVMQKTYLKISITFLKMAKQHLNSARWFPPLHVTNNQPDC